MAEVKQAQAPAAKVLRIGVVQGGKVIHEQLIKPGESVTLGESPKNTVVFEHPGLPKRLALFEYKGGRYLLSFTTAMAGKVAADGEPLALEDLTKRPGAVERSGVWQVPIDPGYRGKVGIGDITVLFQFVAAPPEPAKQVSSKDFRPKLLEPDDYTYAGFLSFFSAIAIVLGIYSAVTDAPEIKSLDEVDERFVQLVLAPKEDPKPPEELPVDENLPAIEKEGAEVKKKEEADSGEKKPPKAKNAAEQAQNDAYTKEAARQNALGRSAMIGLLGTVGSNNNGNVVADVLGEADGNLGSVADMLASGANVAVATSSADVGLRGGKGTGRGEDASVGGVGPAGTGGGDSQVAKAEATPARKSSAKLGAVSGSAENMDSLTATIRKYQAGVKQCYDTALKSNPNLAGRIEVDVDINAGRVTSVSIGENTIKDANFATCVSTKIRSWRFDPSVSDSVSLPFTFTAG